MAVFSKAVSDLKSAGATVVDPIVIPDLVELQRTTSRRPEEEALEVWLARNPNSPFRTLADVAKSPEVDKIYPRNKAERWKNPPWPPFDKTGYGQYVLARQQLLLNILKVMADHDLDAIVYRTMERSPSLLPGAAAAGRGAGGRGAGGGDAGGGGTPTLNTFLVYVPALTVPSGFTPDGLPTGLTFLGRPYDDASMIRLAYSYEQATHHRRPPSTTPPLRQ
jgi:Asp-tRNA(Asn)/Glu-tRNA(Gln) amidotransferase A subunit family amidase